MHFSDEGIKTQALSTNSAVMDSDQLENDDQRIGYHQGALETLSKERQELTRILQIVEQLMQMHIGELQDLGVDITEDDVDEDDEQPPEKDEPIEDLLD
jgi:hypothetical protein